MQVLFTSRDPQGDQLRELAVSRVQFVLLRLWRRNQQTRTMRRRIAMDR